MAEILRLDGVSKSYGAITVADAQSWTLHSGEALGVIGPNGAGKTSMFNLVTGTIAPDGGRIFFDGQDITAWPAARRCRGGIARSFQVPQPIGGMTVWSGWVSFILTVFAIVVVMNAVNFIDGLDGLASGVVGIAALSFFGYAYLISQTYNPPNVFSTAALISAAVIGCAVGFLPHNFFPARIFMGDSGALLFGLLLAAATISITGSVAGADVSANPVAAVLLPLAVPLAIFLLPLIDVVWAVIRRTKAGRRPWQPDAGHLHHRMLAFGHGHRRAVLLLWGWAAAISLGSVAFVFFDARIATGIFVIMLGTAAALTLWLPRAVVGGRRPQPDAPSTAPPGSQP